MYQIHILTILPVGAVGTQHMLEGEGCYGVYLGVDQGRVN